MLTPPPGITLDLVAAFAAKTWGGAPAPAHFAPLGEDSWNYRCGTLWVSLRRDLRGHVPDAYSAAAVLRADGLEFVLAPLPTQDGRVSARLNGYPVVAFPWHDVTPCDGAAMTPALCNEALEKLARLHRTPAPGGLPVEVYDLPFEGEVVTAIEAGLGAVRDTGPLSEALAALLSQHAEGIAACLHTFQTLARKARAARHDFGPTHGEPLPTNWLRAADGLLLADWGEAALGPPERDLAHLIRTTGVRPGGDPALLELYRYRWVLSEVAEYSSVLLAPHEGHADDRAMFARLLHYLPPRQPLPESASRWKA